jgi:glutamate/tyrosine decarboxylase-like PLP-dependent enzyme
MEEAIRALRQGATLAEEYVAETLDPRTKSEGGVSVGAPAEAVVELAQALLQPSLGSRDQSGRATVVDPSTIPVGAWPTLADEPCDTEAVLAFLGSVGSRATVRSTGGKYFGFVTGGSLPSTMGASVLTSAWDQNCFSHVTSPAVALFEEAALAMVKDLLRVPRTAEGTFTTGATMANFTGLLCARNAQLALHGWDASAEGLWGAPPITVFVGEEAHASIFKVLGMLGLGRTSRFIVKLPVDGMGRILESSVDGLKVDGPAILCLQAGNVNSGAVDPAPKLVSWARKQKIWVHVDGAFGLWACAACPTVDHHGVDGCDDLCPLFEGYSEADSWCVDAHKWLNTPYDCGIALVRDAEAMRRALHVSGSYLSLGDDHRRDAINVTPDSSRRARGVDVWAALQSLGRQGFRALLVRNCLQATSLARALSDTVGVRVLNEPIPLNQVVVRFWDDDAATATAIKRLQDSGDVWCGSSQWKGEAVMRVSFSSWVTTMKDVDAAAGVIKQVAQLARPK